MNASSKIREHANRISDNVADAKILLRTITNALDSETDIVELKNRVGCYTLCAMRCLMEIEESSDVILTGGKTK